MQRMVAPGLGWQRHPCEVCRVVSCLHERDCLWMWPLQCWRMVRVPGQRAPQFYPLMTFWRPDRENCSGLSNTFCKNIILKTSKSEHEIFSLKMNNNSWSANLTWPLHHTINIKKKNFHQINYKRANCSYILSELPNNHSTPSQSRFSSCCTHSPNTKKNKTERPHISKYGGCCL